MERSASRALLFAFLLITAAACGDGGPAAPPENPEGPRIEIIAGQNRSDTVDAVQSEMLHIGVWASGGRRLINAVVHVESITLDARGPEMQAAGVEDPSFHTLTSGITDLQGTVRFRVKMGRKAGPGRLVITVPGLGLSDTARYTILPGAATGVQMLPQDTTVGFGGRVALRTALADRHGNPRNDALTLAVASGPATLDGSTVVAGSSIGLITAVASAGGRSDTTLVRVAPPGSVAAVSNPAVGFGGALYTFSLDGSNIRQVLTSVMGPGYNLEMSAAWLSPTRLVYHDGSPDHTRQLYTLDLATGTSARFLPPADQLSMEQFPRVSPDGSWVYFGGGTSWNYAVYRARADGSGRELVSSDSLPVYSEWGADASPDGTRIVYVKRGVNWGDEKLYLMDLASRAVTPLNLKGISPRWSPDGTRIAYVDQSTFGQGRAAIVNADGTGARVLSNTLIFGDLSWSPDGKYLVGAGQYVYQLVVIDVATGAEVALNYPSIQAGVRSPVWKP